VDIRLPIVALVVFAICVAVPLFTRDRVYPFSELSMFASSYRPMTVITLRSPDGTVRYPTPRYLGCTTSGLSKEYLARDGTLADFLDNVRAKARQQRLSLPEDATLWAETITTSSDGRVTRVVEPLASVAGDGNLTRNDG
jgi:hypothetical protein